jgi:hypothetical protein
MEPEREERVSGEKFEIVPCELRGLLFVGFRPRRDVLDLQRSTPLLAYVETRANRLARTRSVLICRHTYASRVSPILRRDRAVSWAGLKLAGRRAIVGDLPRTYDPFRRHGSVWPVGRICGIDSVNPATRLGLRFCQ